MKPIADDVWPSLSPQFSENVRCPQPSPNFSALQIRRFYVYMYSYYRYAHYMTYRAKSSWYIDLKSLIYHFNFYSPLRPANWDLRTPSLFLHHILGKAELDQRKMDIFLLTGVAMNAEIDIIASLVERVEIVLLLTGLLRAVDGAVGI